MKPTQQPEETLPLARHAPTKLNAGEGADEKSRGWLRVPPDPDELERVGLGIAAEFEKHGVKRIVSSDLPRASKTAAFVADHMDIPFETTRNLRTWNVGDMAGKSEAENLPKKKKFVKYPDETPPGGEPFSDFTSRWEGELNKWIEHNSTRPDDKVGLLIHGNMVMAARPILDGDDVKDEDWELKPPGSVAVVRIPEKGEPYLDMGDEEEEEEA